VTARARWKRRERATARLLGTERVPSNGHAQPDIVTGGWAVEHNSRETLPVWLTRAVDQARRNAGDGCTPAVVLAAGQGAGRPLRRVVLLDFGDWCARYQREDAGV
jgi:hypothetical protein